MPDGAPGVLHSVFDGKSFAVLPLVVFYLLVALGLTGWTFLAGDDASVTATAAELGVRSMGRVAILVVDALLLGLGLIAWAGATPMLRRRVPANAVYGITLVLAVLVMLVASGELRDWAVARHVPEMLKITGEQDLETARAGPPGTAPMAGGAQSGAGCAEVIDLHLAVAGDCVDRLRGTKSSLERRSRLGQTPLALAVLQNKHGAAEALLSQGADVNAPIRFRQGEVPVADGLQRAQRPELAAGSTPLIMARDAAMVALLLRAGAAKNVKNTYGWSAVFYYTHHGSVEMLDTLLAAGADINATADVDPSHRGTTALMWAAYMNRTAHLQTLLKYQPKRDMRDAAGKTALDYAKGFGHAEAVRLLSSAAP